MGRAKHIGLTGGIGSGKSTVAALLEKSGARRIDADALSRATTAPGGAAMPAITQAFGAEVVAADGGLHRAAMRDRIFADPDARRQLEAIIHPLVGAAIRSAAEAAPAAGVVCLVYDIPLLVESHHWRQRLDSILVIDCSESTQIRRVQQRNGLSEGEVRAIITAQAARSTRLSAADHVLCNDAITLPELEALVQQIARQFGL
ncbi:dephospho-CoA kinase [Rhodoferax sp. OV413]|uniref:dephospho-CoA kinase n=1 Tax=Rhodoferax sp. OV413 TaxID=1855285 RepID=UPI0025DAF44D|nr:dephospho-CoA kinase [Rhodoferax sp. OV413]